MRTVTHPLPHHDVAVIGAGPMGLELAVNLRTLGVDYIHFEAKQIGHTMTWWPRNTPFFSTTERLAIAGVPIQDNHQQRITGEDYLAYLRGIVEQFDLPIHSFTPVTAIAPQPTGGFLLTTETRRAQAQWHVDKVVLAIGDMDYPNLLHIPGEELPFVSHYFRDPHDYFRQRLLIVGGKNSAAEAALRCWRAGAEVTISYRRARLDQKRIKHWLLPDLEAQIEAGNIGFLPQSVPIEITPDQCVWLQPTDAAGHTRADAQPVVHETDFVLLNTGFRGDQRLLEMAGVRLEGPNRVPQLNTETMETNVPGLYLVGTVSAGIQQRYTVFIETSHPHVAAVVRDLTGQAAPRIGTVSRRTYEPSFAYIEAN
ncbi:MAG: NAD(P)-binding domain-containing protein [Anaerolineales bacterium]|nr:NAD(P)-binding domain-containing protein [Anaerolineales bacterium]MCB9129251.1 NAD(P)-binding domain-containing protein [Ardenticatenales bacterium]MCB9171331.1 NAD(P)-binding domain-containing protein [Ardenticatenales bacterium]